jgi:hypothetical protein
VVCAENVDVGLTNVPTAVMEATAVLVAASVGGAVTVAEPEGANVIVALRDTN